MDNSVCLISEGAQQESLADKLWCGAVLEWCGVDLMDKVVLLSYESSLTLNFHHMREKPLGGENIHFNFQSL